MGPSINLLDDEQTNVGDMNVPHITDSDVGDNDDLDIIEAEDKLAAYFKRHKQRQIVLMDNNIEPIKEQQEEKKDCDLMTPPLQEEVPYIVDDGTLSVDRAMSNVSVSNVANSANSNCSTRGESTRGDDDKKKEDEIDKKQQEKKDQEKVPDEAVQAVILES